MGNQTDYFNRIGYKPVYHLGDRVIGKWGKIPFVATVGNDRCIDGVNPEITVHLDLPIKVDDPRVYLARVSERQDIKQNANLQAT